MPTLYIVVRDFQKQPLNDKDVSVRLRFLDAHKIKRSDQFSATFSKKHGCFVANVEFGTYTCLVTPIAKALEDKLEPQEHNTVIDQVNVTTSFVLGNSKMPFYYQNGIPIPYMPIRTQLAVYFKSERLVEALIIQGYGEEPITLYPSDSRSSETRFATLESKSVLETPPLPPREGSKSKRAQAPKVSTFGIYDLPPEEKEKDIRKLIQQLNERDDLVKAAQILTLPTVGNPRLETLSESIVLVLKPDEPIVEIETHLHTVSPNTEFVIVPVPLCRDTYEIRLTTADYILIDIANDLHTLTNVVSAEPNVISPATYDRQPANDVLYPNQLYLIDIRAPEAWDSLEAIRPNIRYGDSGITLAVVDASTVVKTPGERPNNDLDTQFPDGTKKIVAAWDLTDHFPYPRHNQVSEHSYSVSGIATAVTDNALTAAGIAGNCRLISAGRGYINDQLDLAKLFAWIAGEPTTDSAHFPPPPSAPAMIINNSWSFSDNSIVLSSALNQVLTTLSTIGRNGRGIPIIFSTGNDNRPIDSFPLHNHPSVINVASVALVDNQDSIRDWVSGYGERIDVCAVGYRDTRLNSFTVTGVTDTINAIIGGTSAAAPQVAGALALALSANPDLTRDQMLNLLQESSDHIHYPTDWTDDRDGDGINDFSQYYGYGRINIGRLAKLARIVQTKTYFRLNAEDAGDIFGRNSANWDSIDIDFDPATGDVRLWVFNPDTEPAELAIRLYALMPTLLPLHDDWTLLDTLSITIPPNDHAIATTTVANADRKLLFAQVYTPWYDLTQETQMATYARVLRWSRHIAWKQPQPQPLTIGTDSVIAFDAVCLSNSDGPVLLKIDLSNYPASSSVALHLPNGSGLIANLPPEVQQIGSVLELPPGHQVFLSLNLPIGKTHLEFHQQFVPGTDEGLYRATISQYIKGFLVGQIAPSVQLSGIARSISTIGSTSTTGTSSSGVNQEQPPKRSIGSMQLDNSPLNNPPTNPPSSSPSVPQLTPREAMLLSSLLTQYMFNPDGFSALIQQPSLTLHSIGFSDDEYSDFVAFINYLHEMVQNSTLPGDNWWI